MLHKIIQRSDKLVSPGHLIPGSYFGRVIDSGQYLLPQYVHAFVLASDVKIYFPHLGSWHFSDEHESSGVINTLMEYAFAEKLSGNFGPFSFDIPKFGSGHNYQIKRNKLNGGLVITLPGAQVVGYIMNTIPKFPRKQNRPRLDRTYCDCYEAFKATGYNICPGMSNTMKLHCAYDINVAC